MDSVSRLLYKSLYRTCQRYDLNIPRNKHILWHTEDQSMVQTLRKTTRKLNNISHKEIINYGFSTLRELRCDFESSLRWYNIFQNYTQGSSIPIESGAIAIAKVANPRLDTNAITKQMDQLNSHIKMRLKENNIDISNNINFVDEEHKVKHMKSVLKVINNVFFNEIGFSGNLNINDPQNTLIDGVLLRKSGIPITLSVIYMSQAQRIGMELAGFRLPGYFLVGYLSETDEKQSFFIDVNNEGTFHTLSDILTWLRLHGISWNSFTKYTSPCTLPQIYYGMIEDLQNKIEKDSNDDGFTEKLKYEKDALEPYV